jgi:hypothetical protein
MFELESHNIYLFHDGEWIKSLVAQFLLRLNYFDVLSLKLNLIYDLEIWLASAMFINIFLVTPLRFPKVGYKLCSNVYQP